MRTILLTALAACAFVTASEAGSYRGLPKVRPIVPIDYYSPIFYPSPQADHFWSQYGAYSEPYPAGQQNSYYPAYYPASVPVRYPAYYRPRPTPVFLYVFE